MINLKKALIISSLLAFNSVSSAQLSCGLLLKGSNSIFEATKKFYTSEKTLDSQNQFFLALKPLRNSILNSLKPKQQDRADLQSEIDLATLEYLNKYEGRVFSLFYKTTFYNLENTLVNFIIDKVKNKSKDEDGIFISLEDAEQVHGKANRDIENNETLQILTKTLTPRERFVFESLNVEGVTLKELSKTLNISRTRVDQIKKKIEKKINRQLEITSPKNKAQIIKGLLFHTIHKSRRDYKSLLYQFQRTLLFVLNLNNSTSLRFKGLKIQKEADESLTIGELFEKLDQSKHIEGSDIKEALERHKEQKDLLIRSAFNIVESLPDHIPETEKERLHSRFEWIEQHYTVD